MLFSLGMNTIMWNAVYSRGYPALLNESMLNQLGNQTLILLFPIMLGGVIGYTLLSLTDQVNQRLEQSIFRVILNGLLSVLGVLIFISFTSVLLTKEIIIITILCITSVFLIIAVIDHIRIKKELKTINKILGYIDHKVNVKSHFRTIIHQINSSLGETHQRFESTSPEAQCLSDLFTEIDQHLVPLDDIEEVIPLTLNFSQMANGFYVWYAPKSEASKQYHNLFHDTTKNQVLMLTKRSIIIVTPIVFFDTKEAHVYDYDDITSIKFEEKIPNTKEFSLKTKQGNVYSFSIYDDEAELLKSKPAIISKAKEPFNNKYSKVLFILVILFLSLIILLPFLNYVFSSF